MQNYAVTEKRKQVRSKMNYASIIIFNLETAERLGRMENLSAGGFLLKSEMPVTVNEVYRISMSLPESVNRKSVIRCSTKSLWGDEYKGLWESKNNTPDCYWTGFEFLMLDETDTRTVALLIEEFGTPL